MRMSPASSIGICAVLSFGLAACGGDDDGGGSSGVSSSTKISDLTEAQEKSLCEELNDKLKPLNENLKSAPCVAEGLASEAQGAGTCEEVRASCIDDADDPIAPDDCSVSEAASDCDLTVGDYRECLDAMLKQAEDVFGKITCKSDPADLENLEEPPTPEACKKIDEQCPDML